MHTVKLKTINFLAVLSAVFNSICIVYFILTYAHVRTLDSQTVKRMIIHIGFF